MRSDELLDNLINAITLPVSEGEKRAIVRWLMEDRLGHSLAEIQSGINVDKDEAAFESDLRRINRHEPLQYILGHMDFYGRRFSVSPAVLIPRPETELMVHHVINTVGKSFSGKVIDIGTGSGCIAISLALELPQSQVFATDIDLAALNIATQNAANLGARVTFLQHDILHEPLPLQQLDVVVSNPPYILEAERSSMSKNVTAFEPPGALFVPDRNPLVFHRAIAQKAATALNPGGLFVMELNEELGPETAECVMRAGYSGVALLKDLDGKNRFVTGSLPSGQI